MNFEPQTYEELIRMKRCVELTKYYEVTEEELWEIYHFLEQEPEAFIKGGRQNLSLLIGQNTVKTQKVIMANCTDRSIDGILLSRTECKVFPITHHPQAPAAAVVPLPTTIITITTIITMAATVRQARATVHQAAQISLQAIQAQAVQVRASRQVVQVHLLPVQAQVQVHLRASLHSRLPKTSTRAKLGTMQSIKRFTTLLKLKKYGFRIILMHLSTEKSME